MKGDGIWELRYLAIAGHTGIREQGGVLILDAGRIHGGDTWSFYRGTFSTETHLMQLRFQRRAYRGAAENSAGPPQLDFDCTGTGLISGDGELIDATLSIITRPQVQLMARLCFLSSLIQRRS